MALTANTHSVKLGGRDVTIGNTTSSFNTRLYNSEGDEQLMLWLSPLEPSYRHDFVRTTRLEGVGDWLLETSEFREWSECEGGADKALLFCSGNPGVGKTYLSSLVIDKLCDQARGEDSAVARMYCDCLAQREQTAVNIIGAVLKQLLGRREIPKDIREAFHEERRPLLPDLLRMLRIAIASLSQVFICIDALDEFLPKNLSRLLESLRDIVRESPRTRIFLTGRPHVKETIRRYFTKAVMIPISPNQDDVRNYVEKRLDKDDEPEAMNQDLRADIVKMILDKMSDMFLLASLNIEAILSGITIGHRRKILQEMARGNGLSDAYTATITLLKAQKGNRPGLGLQALMWVLCSERPLRAEELCHALGVEIGSSELDPENIPALQILLASCLGLLAVESSSSTVRLVHFTLQEHLSHEPTLFHSFHSTIAEVCLTYLNFGSVGDLSSTLDSAPSTMPLLGYASFHWGGHAKRRMTEKVRILGKRFFEKYHEHISAQLVELSNDEGLKRAAVWGTMGAIIALSETEEVDFNVVNWIGGTALSRTIKCGQEAVVKMLLEREDQNVGDDDSEYGFSPLILAAVVGHEGIVKMLLERDDINPNHQNSTDGATPLSLAATMGHEGVVKMLLERADVNPEKIDTEYGRTPLLWAAKNGHVEVVKMLLERREVNPDQWDTEYGRTPLLWAAKNGHVEVVKMLSERGVDYYANAEDDPTPVSWAAENGHEFIQPCSPHEPKSAVGHLTFARIIAGRDLPETKMTWLSRLLCIRLPKPFRRQRKTKTYSNNPYQIPLFALDRCSVLISHFVLFAFFLPPTLQDIVLFNWYLTGGRGAGLGQVWLYTDTEEDIFPVSSEDLLPTCISLICFLCLFLWGYS